jgi:hypothetical protein
VIAQALRKLVRERAGNRCEYRHVAEEAEPFFTFHNEHIRLRQHAGSTDEANLALACHHCNLHKGPNLTAIDPDTNLVVALFNPRTQEWLEHFTLAGVTVVGRTATGRATVRLLKMNAPARLQLRAKSGPLEGGGAP